MIETLILSLLSLATLGLLIYAIQQLQAWRSEQTELKHQSQIETLRLIQESIQQSMSTVREEITKTLSLNAELTSKELGRLTDKIDVRLKEISGQVDKRLSEGFDKTHHVFADVIKRLALIDEAQKKIVELSGSVMDLNAVLSDKKSRGAFGEVQLNSLIRNMMPENSFALQHTLSNGTRPDCILFLPEPTGHLVIDAKFPLEGYQALQTVKVQDAEYKLRQQTFKKNIKQHIDVIAEKYIVPGETSDGAMMFIPAEAIFAEVHAQHPDLVQYAHDKKVWLVSPTTMMAVLTTALAVLKDVATQKQIHIIQEHLGMLGQDFGRFQKRMDNLARHIGQAQQDVEDVHKSSRKITNRFEKIESVELQSGDPLQLLVEEA